MVILSGVNSGFGACLDMLRSFHFLCFCVIVDSHPAPVSCVFLYLFFVDFFFLFSFSSFLSYTFPRLLQHSFTVFGSVSRQYLSLL